MDVKKAVQLTAPGPEDTRGFPTSGQTLKRLGVLGKPVSQRPTFWVPWVISWQLPKQS